MKTLEQRVYELILNDAYIDAKEQGYISWLMPTRVDPGCWDREVDLDLAPLVESPENGSYAARAVATVGGSQVFDRTYTFQPKEKSARTPISITLLVTEYEEN